MTREEHLEFCRQCRNRKFDSDRGIVCGLTGQMAAFEKECEDFKVDNSVVITVDDQTALDSREIQAKLPPEILKELRDQQNLTKAIVAGVFAALLCAILWAAFAVYTTMVFRGMALLLGAGVGFAIRRAGKGIDTIFGVLGGIFSLIGCIVGNFLIVIGFLAQENDLGYIETLFRFDYSYFGEVMVETFDIRHIIFYILAAGVGFALSKKSITDKDVKELRAKQNAR
jgi:hypothetical protein